MITNNILKKILFFVTLTVLISVSIAPAISSLKSKTDIKRIKEEEISQEKTHITFTIFEKTGSRDIDIELPNDIALEIVDIIEELKDKIINEPFSDETKNLKSEFIDLIETSNMLPYGMSKNNLYSLLNPSWLGWFDKKLGLFDRVTKLSNSLYPTRASASSLFCSMASGGQGLPIPLFILPRPRGFLLWASNHYSVTNVGNLITGKGFLAGGAQTGLALGFLGVGLTYSALGVTYYALIGYSLFTFVNAEAVQWVLPPNEKPVISNENPSDGAVDVPLILDELSFRISDADGDRMSYSVTTSPNVGSGSGNLKKTGIYKVPVSGLEPNTAYTWTVEVSDGQDTTVKQFSFYTEMLPFDPFDEGWSYRKRITVDHDLVEGDLPNFPVLVSVVDSDLRDKAQFDGDDILFMDDIGVAHRLFHEIELYDDSNGELVAWVRIPELDDDVDTVFYMYYGNPDCDNQQLPEMVWDSNFKLVLHMDGSSYDEIEDSTSNNNDVSSASGNPMYDQAGKVGNCVSFDGAGDFFKVGSFSLPADSSHTGTCWIKMPSIEDERRMIFEWDDGWSLSLGYLGSAVIEAYTKTTGPGTYHTTTNPITVDKDIWYFVGTRVDASNDEIIVWLDDSGHNIRAFEGSVYSGKGLNIGTYRDNNGRWMEGEIDEIWISNIVRSDDWIETAFNNMDDPSSFMSFGPEETLPLL